MGTTELREELHRFINRADERMLRLIHGMMKACPTELQQRSEHLQGFAKGSEGAADSEDEKSYALTDAHKEILDERITAHEASPGEGKTWESLKDRITN